MFLGKNKIEKIQNLDDLVLLDCLSLQSNRLTKIENLDKLVNLEQLYLSENQIVVMENLSKNTAITTLDLAVNKIIKIDNISHMENLEEFWVIIIFLFSQNLHILYFIVQLLNVYIIFKD